MMNDEMKTLKDFVEKMTEFHKRLYEINTLSGKISVDEYLAKNNEFIDYKVKSLWPYQDELIAITNGSGLCALALDVGMSLKVNCAERKKIDKKITDAYMHVKWDKRTPEQKDEADKLFEDWINKKDDE